MLVDVIGTVFPANIFARNYKMDSPAALEQRPKRHKLSPGFNCVLQSIVGNDNINGLGAKSLEGVGTACEHRYTVAGCSFARGRIGFDTETLGTFETGEKKTAAAAED